MSRNKALRLGANGLVGAVAALALSAVTNGTQASMSGAAVRANDAPRYVQLAGLFGDSDEEIAAKQREQAQDASLASLTQRVSDLEHTLRQLTGQLEDANHRNVVLQQRIDRMQKDFDYKLCTLSAQQLAAGGDDTQTALPCDSLAQSGSQQGALAPPAATISGGLASQPAGSGTQLGTPPGVLGTLPAGTPAPKPQPGVTVNMAAIGNAPAPATNGNRAEFDAAMNLLAKAQYDEARSAFRSFADAYPKDDLASQAVYWVGAIAYVQKDFPGAARAFAEEIKEYPSSPRAPESMLKLGQSLIAMNQKQEGCTTLGAISGKYPKASKTIQRAAEKARKDARCR